jgi:hypothetical protein
MAGEIMYSIVRFLGIRSSLLSTRKAAIVSAFAGLGIAGAALGAPVNGALGVSPIGGGSATSSSLTLQGSILITQATGDFLTLGAMDSGLTASTATVSGLSTSPTAESIPDYFVFASPSIFPPPFDGPGTTPSNRFDFELTSLTETGFNAASGVSSFSGAGTITDSAAVYDPTPASFTIGFSSPSNYSFTFNTVVPEPTTLGLAAISLGALMMRRRRA